MSLGKNLPNVLGVLPRCKKFLNTFIFIAIPILALSCKGSDFGAGDTKSNDGYRACDQRMNLDRCFHASGSNSTLINKCDGTLKDECPKEKALGRCVNNEGTSEEATIVYYSGEALSYTNKTAAKDCVDNQKIYGGKYYPESD